MRVTLSMGLDMASAVASPWPFAELPSGGRFVIGNRARQSHM